MDDSTTKDKTEKMPMIKTEVPDPQAFSLQAQDAVKTVLAKAAKFNRPLVSNEEYVEVCEIAKEIATHHKVNETTIRTFFVKPADEMHKNALALLRVVCGPMKTAIGALDSRTSGWIVDQGRKRRIADEERIAAQRKAEEEQRKREEEARAEEARRKAEYERKQREYEAEKKRLEDERRRKEEEDRLAKAIEAEKVGNHDRVDDILDSPMVLEPIPDDDMPEPPKPPEPVKVEPVPMPVMTPPHAIAEPPKVKDVSHPVYWGCRMTAPMRFLQGIADGIIPVKWDEDKSAFVVADSDDPILVVKWGWMNDQARRMKKELKLLGVEVYSEQGTTFGSKKGGA